jgi:hypothetical protein
MNKIVFLIGLLFSPLAALMSFIVTYEEYRHHFSESKTSAKKALKTALITFLVFLQCPFPR